MAGQPRRIAGAPPASTPSPGSGRAPGGTGTVVVPTPEQLDALRRIEQRILWLAVRMVDYANHDRPSPDRMKVGGHQASSASTVSILTALYFTHLRDGDRIAVKPHASPVFHAIQYLLGNLDRRYLTALREFGGLQAYPSSTKDPDPVDFSTGSVGLGAVAPLWAAVVDRYLGHHFDGDDRSGPGRFVSLLGDAELDEGSVWEAINDPATRGLANVLWVIDVNRQSLDRVIPGIKVPQLEKAFEDSGWHVVEAKYGRVLQSAFARPGGEALRRYIDEMSNEEYQSLFAHRGVELRERFVSGAGRPVARALEGVPEGEIADLILNLGGHDLHELQRAFAAADAETTRPTVVFAYTIKGWGLPIAGDPLNHAAMLTTEQIADLRAAAGLTPETELDRFDPDSEEGRWCRVVRERLARPARTAPPPAVDVPAGVGTVFRSEVSTQDALGRLLLGLTRHEDAARRIVTTSPDVTISTNLGSWVNKVGVFSPTFETDWFGENRLVRWCPSPAGQHIELGISEMNLFLLLGQLGLSYEHSGELLLPIGTVYDPFVLRGLDAFVYGAYSGSRFIVVGTPSGVTLSYEGGAHQSTVTPSVGIGLPGVTYAEPAYGTALDWLLCDGLRRLADRHAGESLYLRLTTRPIDQTPFDAARERLGDDLLRRHVLAGAYRLVEPSRDATGWPRVCLAASGAVLPEVVAAAALLAEEEVAAVVLDVTSADRVHRGWIGARQRERRRARLGGDFHLAEVLSPAERRVPIVTVHDAVPHALSWLGSVFGTPTTPVGVEAFGQSGSIPDLYRVHDLAPDMIVNAALALLASPPGLPHR